MPETVGCTQKISRPLIIAENPVGAASIEKRTGDTGTTGRAQGEGNEFTLKRTNGNRLPCNQEKDSVLVLKKILKAQVRTFTTPIDHSHNQANRELHVGPTDTAGPCSNFRKDLIANL